MDQDIKTFYDNVVNNKFQDAKETFQNIMGRLCYNEIQQRKAEALSSTQQSHE